MGAKYVSPMEVGMYNAKKFTDEEVKEIIEVLRFLFSKADKEGYVSIFNNVNYYRSHLVSNMKNIQVKKLLSHGFVKNLLNNSNLEPINLFHSVSTYKDEKEATEDNIKQIVSFISDLDYTSKRKSSIYRKLTNEQFLMLLEEEVFDKDIPWPNAVLFTGNNVSLIYKYKYPLIPTDKTKMLTKGIQKELSKVLTDFGADQSANLTTRARFVHSRNSSNLENGVKIKIYHNIKPLEINDYRENWTPNIVDAPKKELPSWYKDWKTNKEQKKEKKKSNKKAGKVFRLRNCYTLLVARIEDLKKIQELRNFDCDSFKELMCWMYRNFVIQRELITAYGEVFDTDLRKLVPADGEVTEEMKLTAEKEMLDFHNGFRKPMRSNIVESKTRNVNRKQYFLSNNYIINVLEIDLQEQKELITIISKEEYALRQQINQKKQKQRQKEERKNENGLTKREQDKLDKINKIKELLNKGFKQVEIAKELGITQQAVSKYKREIMG